MTVQLAASPQQSDPPRYRPLGRRLRARRQALPGLTVALLATALGVTPGTIYQYEAGQHRPRRTTLARLAVVLGIAADELTTLAAYPPRPDAGDDSLGGQSTPQ